ncbi:MAG: shikimate dehydrogenase [Bacteroidetes bacterium]|jgi:shikimate dehydrogenase|nr:shikimate dehydrogenase [Bacteroidota bacterium]
MKKLGLIGKQLSHSFSKVYFEEKWMKAGISDYTYDLFPLPDILMFPALLETMPELVGLNVTIPYKEQIIPYLHDLDPTARETGAVNCIKVLTDKQLIGYNTDTFGFQQSIKPFLEPQHDKALILGTGGASKAVAFVLKNIGVECFFVSRSTTAGKSNVFTYDQLNDAMLAHFKLVINTTPVGMYPDVSSCPSVPFESVGPGHLMYDLVYNPEETEFVKRARQKGAVAVNGLSMLYHQADKAWEIWTKE